MTTETVEAPAPKPAAVDIAAETMLGDLMALTLDELKHTQDVWQKLSKDEQDKAIERVENRTRQAVIDCVRMISTAGFTRLPATLEQIQVKDSIKAVLLLSKIDPRRHELMDASGTVVTLVLANAEQFVDAPHNHKGEPDQLSLSIDKQIGKIIDEAGDEEL